MSIETLKQALEALEFAADKLDYRCEYTITILRNAIEQAEKQEPVAYAVYHRMGGSKTLHWPEQHSEDGDAKEYKLVPLYTTPPTAQRQWVGLTQEQRNEIAFNAADEESATYQTEDKLRELNEGTLK